MPEVKLIKEEVSDNKVICDVIDTLESLITAVKPLVKEGYMEGTVWIPAISMENRREIEDKIMEMVRKIK